MFDCCIFPMSLSLFFFSNYIFFRVVDATTYGAGRDAMGPTRAAIATQGGVSPTGTSSLFFVLLSTLLISSSRSSSFSIILFSVEYNDKRGRTGWD